MTTKIENIVSSSKSDSIMLETSGQKRRNLSGISRENAYHNLKVISKIKPGDKLGLCKDNSLKLQIEESNSLTFLKRYTEGTSRYSCILPLCFTIDRIISDDVFSIGHIENLRKDLVILQQTYVDENFHELDCIIERLENMIKHSGGLRFKQKLSGLVDYWTDNYKSVKGMPEDMKRAPDLLGKEVDRSLKDFKKDNCFKRLRLWLCLRKVRKNKKELQKMSKSLDKILIKYEK